MYYRDLHELKNIKYRYTCTLLFHTIQLKQRICFFNIHVLINRGGDPEDPAPPFECVLFANQNHYFMIVGYSNNYVFDFSNVVLQSLINVRPFKMYMYFLYQLHGYRRINELNCNFIDRLI